MKDSKNDIIYSEPVREIINDPPAGIVRFGTLFIASAFVLLLIFSIIIKYPDVIPAPIEITTANPPVTLLAKITGRINRLLVTDGQVVKQGEILALLESAAHIEDITILLSYIDSLDHNAIGRYFSMPVLENLGELQADYSYFRKTIQDLESFRGNDLYSNKILVLRREIEGLNEYLKRLKGKEELLEANLGIEYNRFRRDSLLFNDNLLADSDFENSRESLIKVRLELQQVRLEHSKTSMEMGSREQQVNDFIIQRREQDERLVNLVNEASQNLVAATAVWSKTYLLISNVSGKVSFHKYWSENQTVMKDEAVLSILPDNAGTSIGRISLRMSRSGKVEPGMRVNIKLSGYPYLEYGMVRGEVRSISPVASDGIYIIEVALPDGLKTLYGNTLELSQKMQGTAEIITNRQSLLMKVVNPLKHFASRQL